MLNPLLDALFEGIYIVDETRKITYWSSGAERITGFTAEDVLGKSCHDNILNHIDEQGRMLCLNGCPLHTTIRDRIPRELSLFLQHKQGYRIPVTLRTIPLDGDDPRYSVAEAFIVNHAVNETLPTLSASQSAIVFDAMTGLPNHAYLEQFLAYQMNLERTMSVSFGVILVDIDTFEEFNNIYGRKLSDDVLKMLSKTFKRVFQNADAMGRWRQDEFLFIYGGSITKAQLKSIAEGIRMLSEVSSLRGVTFKDIDVTVSVGGTLYRDGETADELIERAYQQLKASKRKGGNFVTIK